MLFAWKTRRRDVSRSAAEVGANLLPLRLQCEYHEYRNKGDKKGGLWTECCAVNAVLLPVDAAAPRATRRDGSQLI